jgi:uncharacterized damage-inducible protein DinB
MTGHRVLALGTLLAASLVGLAKAQQPPESGFRAEILGDLDRIANQITTLAESAPTDKYLDSEVAFFGRQWTKRTIIYLAMTHFHEHLGQSIAYARTLGVVPPWSQ